MDALLNLNFMASLRTGNIITDMFIAAMVPFISYFVTVFFRAWWPKMVTDFVTLLLPEPCSAVTTTFKNENGKGTDDLLENNVLQDAILKYVNIVSPSDYSSGRYTYKQIHKPTTNKKDLARLLETSYGLFTEPSKDRMTSLTNGLQVDISDVFTDTSGSQSRVEDTPAGGVGSRGKGKGETAHRVSLNEKLTRFTTRDRVSEFAADALTWYSKSIKAANDNNRYLYQPVPKSKAKEGGPTGALPCYRYLLSTEKTFNTLFFPQKERLIQLVNQLETRTGKFAVPGSPQRLTLLLHGPPGTGKTSLVRAIAAHTHRHIFFVSLSRVRTNKELKDCLYEENYTVENQLGDADCRGSSDKGDKIKRDKMIYMLEDIDATSSVVRKQMMAAAQAVNTEKSKKKEKKGKKTKKNSETVEGSQECESTAPSSRSRASASPVPRDDSPLADAGGELQDGAEAVAEKAATDSQGEEDAPAVENVAIKDASPLDADALSVKGVLDALGGFLDSPGRIIILTTNHVEHLDPALTSPGFITMKLHMGNFNAECAVEMVKHYFSESEEVTPDVVARVHHVIQGLKQRGVELSPAAVEQMCARGDTIEELLRLMQQGSDVDIF